MIAIIIIVAVTLVQYSSGAWKGTQYYLQGVHATDHATICIQIVLQEEMTSRYVFFQVSVQTTSSVHIWCTYCTVATLETRGLLSCINYATSHILFVKFLITYDLHMRTRNCRTVLGKLKFTYESTPVQCVIRNARLSALPAHLRSMLVMNSVRAPNWWTKGNGPRVKFTLERQQFFDYGTLSGISLTFHLENLLHKT